MKMSNYIDNLSKETLAEIENKKNELDTLEKFYKSLTKKKPGRPAKNKYQTKLETVK